MAISPTLTRPEPMQTVWGFDVEPLILTASNTFLGFRNAQRLRSFIDLAVSSGLSEPEISNRVTSFGGRLAGICGGVNFFIGGILGGVNALNQGKSFEVITYESLSTGFFSGTGALLAYAKMSIGPVGYGASFLASLGVSAVSNYLLKGGADFLFYSALSD